MTEKSSKNSIYRKCAVISGATGIICNSILSIAKITAGFLSGSAAIITDGFNNFTDAAANLITIIGAKMSQKPMDREHPFGHGRIEYIAALIVAFSIFMISFELFKESVGKVFSPAKHGFSEIYIFILTASIAVKLGMMRLNHILFKRSGNLCLKAVKIDCLSDCVTTAAAIISVLSVKMFGLTWIDGVIGMGISIFIFFSGIIIIKDILNPLLGQAPPREIIYKIEEIIINNREILDVSEIIIHSYGSNSTLASARAAVPADSQLVTVHKLIDGIEEEIREKLNINISIHIDPI